MQPLRRTPSNPALLTCVTEDSATAALRLLAELCRQLPALKEWLWEEFARNATVREAFAGLIQEPAAPLDGFASLAGEDLAWRAERQRLRQHGTTPGIYGGLTWPEMERLFRRYEAGTLDLGTFLLAHKWQAARATGKITPELVRASVTFLDVVTRGDRRLAVCHSARVGRMSRNVTLSPTANWRFRPTPESQSGEPSAEAAGSPATKGEARCSRGVVDVIREARATVVAATQSYQSLIPPMNDERKAKVFIANMANRVTFCAADEDSAKIAADTLGKRKAKKRTVGYTAGKRSSSWTEEDKYWFEPHQLRRLRKFEAIVQHCNGGFRKVMMPPRGPDGEIPAWYRN